MIESDTKLVVVTMLAVTVLKVSEIASTAPIIVPFKFSVQSTSVMSYPRDSSDRSLVQVSASNRGAVKR